VEAEFVIDKTDRGERRKIIERFKSGRTQVLINCMVFTEGFDVPDAAVCANARPTKSTSLYQQMIGRVTRPEAGVVDGKATDEERREAIAKSGKTHALVLDFTGDCGNHKLVSVGDILAGDDVDPIDLEAALIAAEQAGAPVDIEELIEKAKQAREEAMARKEEARKKRMQTGTYAENGVYHSTDVDIFGGRRFDPFSDYTPEPGGATQPQVNRLINLGVSPETATKYTKTQASAVIGEIMSRTGGDYVMWFGKHKGRAIKTLPKSYVTWALKNMDNSEVRKHFEEYAGVKQEEESLPF
jgi:superfamily II DNA/RNA helicase